MFLSEPCCRIGFVYTGSPPVNDGFFLHGPHTEIRVAPGRFELPSQDPESRMIDRYTTGLKRNDMTTAIVDKFNQRLQPDKQTDMQSTAIQVITAFRHFEYTPN